MLHRDAKLLTKLCILLQLLSIVSCAGKQRDNNDEKMFLLGLHTKVT